MRTVSTRFLAALGNPHRSVVEVKVYLPGEVDGIAVDIEDDDSTVSMSGGENARYSADLSLTPSSAQDVYELAETPGAEFRIRSGIDFGLGQVEWVDCGVLYAVDGESEIVRGDFPLTLQDGSTRLEECRFVAPWVVASGTGRVAESAAIVLDAWSGLTVRQEGTESVMGAAVFARDRLAALNEIGNGGNLDQAFDAAGEWVIRDMPLLNPAVPAWTVKTGETGTILPGAKRKIPLNRLYNTVIVGAPEPFQTWGAITWQIADPTHPRHPDKIGVRPFFVSDPTIASRAQAVARAQATLKRLLTVTEAIDIPTMGNPALEYGDTVAVAHSATETDPGLANNYFVEGWTFNLGTGAQDIVGRSTDQPELEEG